MKELEKVVSKIWDRLGDHVTLSDHVPVHAIIGSFGEDELGMLVQRDGLSRADFVDALRAKVRSSGANFAIVVAEAWFTEAKMDADKKPVTKLSGKWPNIVETAEGTPVDTLCVSWVTDTDPAIHLATKTIVTLEGGSRSLDDSSYRVATGLSSVFLDNLFAPAMVH